METNFGIGVFGDFGKGLEISYNPDDIDFALSKSATTGSTIYTNYWGKLSDVPVVQSSYITSEALDYITKIDEKGDENMEILTIYKKRKMAKLLDEFENGLTKLKEENPFEAIIKEANDKIKDLYLEEYKEELDTEVLEPTIILTTKKIQDKEEELNVKYNENKKDVEKLIEEVSARLKLSETGAEKVKVLENYGILDKKGKINI